MPLPSDLIAQLIELESDIRYQEAASAQEPEFRHEPGTLPVLISAPHGATHTRDGDKGEDEYTAGLARLVGRQTEAHVLYARRKSRTDPNVDPAAPYKLFLLQIVHAHPIRFVLDLHGAKAARDFGIALGTMHGKSCPERGRQILVRTFEKYGISEAGNGLSRLDLDHHWPGEGSVHRETIIRFCQRHAIPAAQLELNACLRIPARRADATLHDKPFMAEPGLIINLIEALSEIVTAFY
jgi:hypothetical protein